MPRQRLTGCACTSPLAHFYIYHSGSSTRELHPFTTTTHLASQNAITDAADDTINIQFLFRKRGSVQSSPASPATAKPGSASSFLASISRFAKPEQNPQWTERLAEFASADPAECSVSLAGTHTASQSLPPVPGANIPISLRLEGPYFTIAEPSNYETVVCLVSGTGISGAMAIASAFKELERQPTVPTNHGPSETEPVPGIQSSIEANGVISRAGITLAVNRKACTWTRCIVIWSVRETDYIALPELQSEQVFRLKDLSTASWLTVASWFPLTRPRGSYSPDRW